ncbi:Pre-mRNA-splicing factor syf1 [Smittium mucronatum]|uniref:Pre-mRNA-splicing factor SYF1 n=1 Tax=Smittium mucronatum TaxID=133383 RepID=A0A1R0GTD0_9FUNG|nr:Pre-mRNA-splicing factor syf1 [Smittium mucronatum]
MIMESKSHNLQDSLGSLLDDSDIPFEKDVQSDQYNLRNWLQYINHKSEKNDSEGLVLIYERALQSLPGSYKLWRSYLNFRKSQVEKFEYLKITNKYEKVNYVYERAIMFMHKMPRIWLDYLQFLMKQPRVTQTRRTFDRALRALAVTQHIKIWTLYKKFAHRIGGLTEERIMLRYVTIYPEKQLEIISMYKKHKKYYLAAQQLIKCLDDQIFDSILKVSQYELWTKLCDLIVEYPEDLQDLDAENILREGFGRFKDVAGKMWTSLATFFIANGKFERARDVYEEAMEQVLTVRDFTMIFEAYTMFEESLLTRVMEEEAENPNSQNSLGLIDLRMARFEDLMERRPFLVNSVVLRQSPHSVDEWLKRVELFQAKNEQKLVVDCFEDAISTISPKKALGDLSELWIRYAAFYEDNQKLDDARQVFERAIDVHFKVVSELAKIWCSYAEMEIRNGNFVLAETVLGRAISPPTQHHNLVSSQINYRDEHVVPQKRVFKSIVVWQMYVDLEESSDNVEKTKAAYDQIIQLRIATPQIIVNYADFLKEHGYFEEVFRVYEKGISLFGYPVAFELWNSYLTAFIERYKSTKLERTRDLFEQALSGCPKELSKPLFILYGKFEEDYGQIRNALSIYDRATQTVQPSKARFEMYRFYISKTSLLLGDNNTRKIYEQAIAELADEQQALSMCLEYLKLETKLGEIDRARALFGYGSQFADPRINADFWKKWHQFEVQYGNEDTFKEMLRIKRTIQTRFNTDVSYLSAQLVSQKSKLGADETEFKAFDKATIPNDLDTGSGIPETDTNGTDAGHAQPSNPDEISGMDMDMDD